MKGFNSRNNQKLVTINFIFSKRLLINDQFFIFVSLSILSLCFRFRGLFIGIRKQLYAALFHCGYILSSFPDNVYCSGVSCDISATQITFHLSKF